MPRGLKQFLLATLWTVLIVGSSAAGICALAVYTSFFKTFATIVALGLVCSILALPFYYLHLALKERLGLPPSAAAGVILGLLIVIDGLLGVMLYRFNGVALTGLGLISFFIFVAVAWDDYCRGLNRLYNDEQINPSKANKGGLET